MSLVVLLSDTQLPYHHRKAAAAVNNFLADRGKDVQEVHQIGDFYDFTAVSRWVDGLHAEDGKDLQRELDAGEKWMGDLNSAYKGLKTRIRGNHDDRLDMYLARKAKGLNGLRALEYDTLTMAAEYGWKTEPEPYKIAPRTVAVHGLSVRSKSGYTAHAHLDKLPGNVIHGHTHRAGLVYRTLGKETRWGMELGTLMDVKLATYLGPSRAADWQLSIGVLYVDGRDVVPHLVPISNSGKLIFEGKVYTA